MKLKGKIETSRLVMRSYLKSDRDFCISLWCDEVNGKYMSDPERKNIDEKYLAYFDEMEDDPDGYYMIAEYKDSQVPVGTFCMFPGENGNFDIGYCVSKQYWRDGIGTEMLVGTMRYLKGQGGKSVTAEVADENIASIGLLRKLGFAEIKKTKFRKWNEPNFLESHVFRVELN